MSLHNNRYQVDELLTGRKAELVFDPFDLTDIDVRYGGRGFGKAVAFSLGRHAHPKARPEGSEAPAEPSGIDYLRLLDATHTQHLESRINYTALLGGNATHGTPTDDAAAGEAEGTEGPSVIGGGA